MSTTNVQTFSGDIEIVSNLAVDTNTLFVDSVNNRVGFGKTDPGTAVDINGTITGTTFSGNGSLLTTLNLGLTSHTGTLEEARIPNLGAGKITSGTFDAARIPNLGAEKITSGTLPTTRGGTGTTSFTGSGSNVLNQQPTFSIDLRIGTARYNSRGFYIAESTEEFGDTENWGGGLKVYVDGGMGGLTDFNILPTDDNGNTGSALYPTLGLAGADRFGQIYSTSSSISTSDLKLKRDIEELTQSEHRAASRIRALIKKYRMKSSYEKKGDNARTHIGVIAQDVENILSSEGLNPESYGFLCKDDIYTVDDESEHKGSIITAETPGATFSHTEYSIRYEELLCFLISNVVSIDEIERLENRIQNLETRLSS